MHDSPVNRYSVIVFAKVAYTFYTKKEFKLIHGVVSDIVSAIDMSETKIMRYENVKIRDLHHYCYYFLYSVKLFPTPITFTYTATNFEMCMEIPVLIMRLGFTFHLGHFGVYLFNDKPIAIYKLDTIWILKNGLQHIENRQKFVCFVFDQLFRS